VQAPSGWFSNDGLQGYWPDRSEERGHFEERGQFGERAGLVQDWDTDHPNPALAHEFSHQDRAENARVYISPRQDEADPPALEARRMRQHPGEPSRASARCHQLRSLV